MKKKIVVITVIVGLLSIIAFIIFNRNKNKIKEQEINFAINDTAQINKIIIEMADEKLILEKINNKWKSNNIYIVNKFNLEKLLFSIQLLQLKTPIPENAQETLKKKLKTKGKKISFYNSNNELIKSYYIGEPTSDRSGNYMMLAEGTKVFTIFIPGLKKDLSTIFSLSHYYWKTKTIFSYNLEEIKSVEVKYSETPENSFYIEHLESVNFLLKNSTDTKQTIEYNEENIIFYLSNFKNISYEKNCDDNKKILDSLTTCEPFITITIVDNKENINSIECYKKYHVKAQIDTDRMLGVLNKEEAVIIKYYDFDLSMKRISYLKK